MIQKIRSYLLDNEDHKDSIGWYVVIVMLFPVIGMIFQYRKTVQSYIGTVNNKKIEKSIFNIKLFEQSKLMENIIKMFGEEQASYFFDMLFQGKTLEQFVLSGEIKRILLQQKFEKLVSQNSIAGEYIMLNLKNKSLEKIKSNIGEIPFLLVTGQLKPTDLGSLNVDIKKIDLYCEEVFQVNFLKNLFLVPLSTIEKLVFSIYPSIPMNINFVVYSFPIKRLDEYKKNINLNTIGENEMRSFYEAKIKDGEFQKPRTAKFALYTYAFKDSKEKTNKINNLNEKIKDKLKIVTDEAKGELSVLVKSLEKDFYCKEFNKSIDIIFNKNDFISSSVVMSKNLREEILYYVESNEKKNAQDREKFKVFIDDGLLFLVDGYSISDIEYACFEDIKDKIIDAIIVNRSINLLKLDMEKIRYALEDKEVVGFSNWERKEKVFSKDIDVKNQKSEQKDFYDLVYKKMYSGGLRFGSTFLEFKDDVYSVYYVSAITYEIENKFVIRKDQFYNKEVFVDSIERLAKIEMND